MDKNRAKIEILNYITAFFLSRSYDGKINYGGFGNSHFRSDHSDYPPQKGDLVAIQSGPHTEWYLSWYIDIELCNSVFTHKHLLESIETGKLCNWHNISFLIMNRDIVKGHPEWRWTDKQFRFKDKWFRACYKKRGAYIHLPCNPVFKDDGSVELTLRKRFGWGKSTKKHFDNWKMVRVKDMLEFYDSVEGQK